MRKYVWAVVVVLIVGLFLAGCGKKEEQVQSGKQKITYMFAGGSTNEEIIKEATALFKEKHPNIEVELIYVPDWGAYNNKIATAIASNTAPDVVALDVTMTGNFLRKNALLDLSDYINNDPEFQKIKEDIFPATLWHPITAGDKIYGIPAWQNPDVMYYNKNHFDEAGIPYPDASWDYDRFVKEAMKLTKKENGKIVQFGTWGLGWYWNYLWAYGADILNEDGTECIITKPEAKAAIQFLIDLSNKHRIAPAKGEAADQTDYQAFMTGKVSTFVSGHYMVPMLKDVKEFEWDIAVPPHGKNRVYYNNVIYWQVLAATKAPDAAWEYVKFLASPEVQRLIVERENDVPILRSMMESDAFLNPAVPPKSDQVYIDALAASRTCSIHIDSRVSGLFTDALDAIKLGVKDIDTALAEAAKDINEHLRER